MPILIKNMEMPESCEDCRFAVEDYGGLVCAALTDVVMVHDLFLIRHDECLLVEIVYNK